MASDALHELPIEQQIGQLFFIGLPGAELDEEARQLIEEVNPGGIIIFGRNVATPRPLRGLLDGVRELLPIGPLAGVDQEGGLADPLRALCPPRRAARTL